MMITALMTLCAADAGARQPSAEDKPTYGGTLILGTPFKPAPINPVFTTHSISSDLMNLIFNGLVRLNPLGEYEPDLAERWEISPDDLIYTFYLRKGVRFHDGVELTARDVLFSFDQYRNPSMNSPFRSKYDKVDRIEMIDAYTVRFHLKEVVPLFIEQLNLPVIPRHILEGKDLQDDPFKDAPVGSGPFRFVRWNRDTDEMELEYNPDYFEGRPYLDRIVIRVYPDPASMWSGLMRHEIDFVPFVSKADYQVLDEDPAFKAYRVSAEAYSAVVYNLEDPILADGEVRKAIAYSIDVEGILNRLPDIQGFRSTGPINPQSAGFNPDVQPFEYNPDKAGRILEDNGWQDLNRDGIFEKNGKDLEIRLLVDENDLIHKRVALVIRQQLAESGIRLILQLYDDFSELNTEYLSAHQSQAWLRYYPAHILRESDAVNAWSSGFTMPGQFWTHKNEVIDRLIEQARAETKSEKSSILYKEIHQVIYEEQPACFLFFHENLFALNARFKGAEDFFNKNMATYTIKDWYLSEQN